MADPFVGEIRIVGFNFAPTGWATCDGQLQPISQNTALFSLLGTFYGGDGKSTFALPNLQGMVPIHQGQGAGLTQRFIGETSGQASVTLLTTEMPIHSHTAMDQPASPNPAPLLSPAGNIWAVAGARRSMVNMYASAAGAPAQMSAQSLAIAGSSLPHNNLHPYLCLLFVIALQGVFPSRA